MSRLKKGHKLTRLGLTLAYAGLLVLFACPLATSTLAWFSIGSYNTIRNIEFGFDPGTNITAELKDLNTGEWTLPDDDGCFHFSDQFSFTPVSNMFSSDWYSSELDPENDKPKYMVGYSEYGDDVTRTSYASENHEYISLEFRFTCDRDIYLFLDPKTNVAADTDANSKAAGIYGYDKESLNRIENACRISFFSNMGYTIYEPNAEESSAIYYGGRLNVRGADGYWDADSNGKEILYGEYDAAEASSMLDYQLVTTQETPGNGLNAMEAVSKKGNLAITDDSLSSFKEEGHIARETSYTLSELGINASTRHPVLYIPAGQTRHLTVSIYIEGWDPDCDTYIETATLAASITFNGVYANKGSKGWPTPVLGEDAKQN